MSTEQTETDVFVGFAADEAPEPKAPESAQDAQEAPDATDVADDAEIKPDAPETGEGEGEDEPDGDEEKAKRRSKPAPERIAELTRARREAERRAEAAEAELERMRGSSAGDQNTADTTVDTPKPSPDDFEFGEADPGYIEALTEWKVDQRLAAADQKREAALEQAAQRERAAALDSGWQEQTAKAAERYEDFGEVIADYTKTQPCPPILAMAIQSSEHGADVAYHLAKNPTENAELASLAQRDPLEAARRFGRLEARFEAREEAPKPKAKTVTDAPEPPMHRARGAAGRFETPDDTDDLEAFSNKFFAKR